MPGYEVSTWIGLFAPGTTPRPIVEKLVTLGKRGNLHARRQARLHPQLAVLDHQGGQRL